VYLDHSMKIATFLTNFHAFPIVYTYYE